MASSHKLFAVCFCLMLASFGVIVEAGSGGMGGLFGGKGKHGEKAIEALLAAGILAKLLKSHGHHGLGGYSARGAASTFTVPEQASHNQELPHNFGLAGLEQLGYSL